MKNLKKIGVVLLAVAMLCSMSVVAFADDVNAVVQNSDNDSQILINSAKVVPGSGILTITLDYSITGGVQEGDQITMLGYIFNNTEATTGDAAAFVEGNIRAIDQTAAVETNGKVVFTLATSGDYAVAEDAIMAVKLGSDAANVTKAQAFLIDLNETEEQAGILGDADGDGDVDMDDARAAMNNFTKGTALVNEAMAKVDNDDDVDMDDARAIMNNFTKGTAFPKQ